ncbi:hypothetical protein FRC10_011346 [Ceratobasidium sp. 414]|nr:hypothetical protein FRC10_011346 [Ceratobasidium sp. 414]
MSHQAASTTSSAQPSWSRAYSASEPSVAATEDGSVSKTNELWATVRDSTIRETDSPSVRSVRFADKEMPSCHSSPRQDGSPVSQASSLPSLSHSADPEYDGGVECPPTPESKPLKSCLSKRRSESPPPPHAAAYSTIGQIVHEFHMYAVAFPHLRELDFEAPTTNLNVVPALSFTARNWPLLVHVQNLEALQTELSGIESYGDHMIHKTRKEAVVMIQNELDGLRRVQARIWYKVHAIFQATSNNLITYLLTSARAKTEQIFPLAQAVNAITSWGVV